jgi:ClpP class serine protease
VEAAKKRGKMRGTKTNTAKYFKQLLSEETWLTAKEAKELGLIDEIGTLPLQFQEIQQSQTAQMALSELAGTFSDAARESLAAILKSSNQKQMFNFSFGAKAPEKKDEGTQMTQEQFDALVDEKVEAKLATIVNEMQAGLNTAMVEFQGALIEAVGTQLTEALASRDEQINTLLDQVEEIKSDSSAAKNTVDTMAKRQTLGALNFARNSAADDSPSKTDDKKGFKFGFDREAIKDSLKNSLTAKAEA